MVKVICGKKGSGKTKKIIDAANQAQQTTNGNIVFIDDDNKCMFDINHSIRFINAKDYKISNADQLQGMLIGLLAGNYDLQVVFLDGMLRMIEESVDELDGTFKNFEELANTANIDLYVTLSADESELPDSIKKFII